ncbi:MAG: DNA polymerase III subunit delta [Pseudomonadota bacterium]|nr:DNA polymerase III subunit delta [Pseudomonadota bacterium]MEE3072235.1 DNA polymerase III subunit delta [Pseudomonadota bacterium]
MKLNPRDARSYIARPDPTRPGILLYGADPMRVADRRQKIINALIGPEGEGEMRLTRINGADLRKDGALLTDAIKEQGFFPGARCAFVEDATDGCAKAIQNALESWSQGDANIVITAGQLAAKSALRKLFEAHQSAYALGIYNDPPGRDEIEATVQEAGLGPLDRDAMDALIALAQTIEPGDLRQTIEKLALYKYQDSSAVTVADITACAPASVEAEVDDLLDIVANGTPHLLGPVLRRLEAQGSNPTALMIMALRHFRTLHVVASAPDGAAAGVAALKPPVFGPRRSKLERQGNRWSVERLQRAITLLVDTDLTLRSAGQTAPQMALVERALLRLTMMNR